MLLCSITYFPLSPHLPPFRLLSLFWPRKCFVRSRGCQVAQKTPSVRLGLEDGKKFASGCAVVEPRSPEAFNKKPPRKPEKENLVQEEVHPGKVIAVPCPGVARVYSRCRRLRLLFADPSPGTLTRMN